MARKINRLSTRFVAALLERANRGELRPEDYQRGLYLSVSENGGVRWVFLYRCRGKLTEIGLRSRRIAWQRAPEKLHRRVSSSPPA